MTPNPNPICWTARPFVSVAEAAQILLRSPTWVRGKLVSGGLRGNRDEQGRIRVATGSIIAMAREMPAPTEMPRPILRRRHLSLVVSNN